MLARKLNIPGKNGFTLIEIIVAVAIISIFALLAVTSYQNHIGNNYRREAKNDINIINQGIKDYIKGNPASALGNLASKEDIEATLDIELSSNCFNYAIVVNSITDLSTMDIDIIATLNVDRRGNLKNNYTITYNTKKSNCTEQQN